jgi:hypothetical protein
MNKFNKGFFYFNEALFFILTIIIVIMSISEHVVHKEGFVPKKVKEFYRPIHRNIRMTYEGFYDNSSKHISNLFRKFGIL